MYKEILVPLDGSKRAEKILPHVEELARMCGAEVMFLQVLECRPVVPGIVGALLTKNSVARRADSVERT